MKRFVTFLVALLLILQVGKAQEVALDITAPEGICNGSVSVTEIDSTTLPYTYLWDFNSTEKNESGLCEGVYSLTVTNILGCQSVYVAVLESCMEVELEYSPSLICGLENSGSAIVRVKKSPSYPIKYEWSTGLTTRYGTLSNLSAGDYCVTITPWLGDVDCRHIECFKIAAPDCPPTNTPPEPPVIVSEFSNDYYGNGEYIELLVWGESCEDFDLRGFIVDDNNGSFKHPRGGYYRIGIAHGHIRFRNIERWANVKPGSLILIYDPLNKNKTIKKHERTFLKDDPTDSNNDNVYVLPINDIGLEGTHHYPRPEDPLDYRSSTVPYYPYMRWEVLKLYNSTDAVQVRYPDGQYCHGLSYGRGEKALYERTSNINTGSQVGGPDNLHLYGHGWLSNGACYMIGTNWKSVSSFTCQTETYSGGYKLYESPGQFNTQNLEYAILEMLKSRCYGRSRPVVTDSETEEPKTDDSPVNSMNFRAFPVPFDSNLNVEFENEGATEYQLEIYDTMGKRVFYEKYSAIEGFNQTTIQAKGLSSGVYNLSLKDNLGRYAIQRIVYIRK